ncbi:MAG: flavodoxin domain-containing protein [Usitatibacter sp.]
MSRIAIVFATVDGQAGRIAQRVGEVLARAGHQASTIRAGAPGLAQAMAESDGIIVGGAIRYGRHVQDLEEVVRANVAAIERKPNAFFSVSLSGGGPGARPAVAARYAEELAERSGWHPQRMAIFGGALRYSTYNPFIRFMMRLIVGMAGGDTDTSRDYEYTDWEAVERFAAEFAARLASPREAGSVWDS